MSAVLRAGQLAGLLPHPPPRDDALRLAARLPDGLAVPLPVLALATHLAVGASAGALGALLLRRPGSTWGAVVWAVGYAGVQPALGALPRADRDRRDRQAVLLAAHLVWGASLRRLVATRP